MWHQPVCFSCWGLPSSATPHLDLSSSIPPGDSMWLVVGSYRARPITFTEPCSEISRCSIPLQERKVGEKEQIVQVFSSSWPLFTRTFFEKLETITSGFFSPSLFFFFFAGARGRGKTCMQVLQIIHPERKTFGEDSLKQIQVMCSCKTIFISFTHQKSNQCPTNEGWLRKYCLDVEAT